MSDARILNLRLVFSLGRDHVEDLVNRAVEHAHPILYVVNVLHLMA